MSFVFHSRSCLVLALLTGIAIPPAARAGEPAADFDTLQVSRLVCVIGNNAAAGEHRAGYNGVFRLHAPGESTSAFVPAYAGLNLEHYFDGRSFKGDRRTVFEPRHDPMTFRRLGPRTAELHQPATTVFGVESRTRFELRDPWYLDVTFTLQPHHQSYPGGFLGVFWASYINEPDDKSIHFLEAGSTLDAPRWVQFSSQVHGRDATVRRHDDHRDFAMEPDPRALYRNFSPLRYAEPFFYGRIRDHVLIYLFEPNPFLRFAQSPTGGSRNAAGDGSNPAWDFQLVMPEAEAVKGVRLAMRLVYKPWAGRADVLREVRNWRAGSGALR
ncbi:MAG: hypothetical protein FJ399_09265 [Verrucomicrobia bacterium]|nr:hypothetical protein [Verrucomicrobiota bacterium]